MILIDASATNPTIAGAIRDGYHLAVKANQPGLRAEVELKDRSRFEGTVKLTEPRARGDEF